MKNLALAFIVLALLIFAYFHEEVGKSEKKTAKLQSQKIISFNINEVNSITLPNTTLIKKNELWVVEQLDFRASNVYVKKLLEIIDSIHKLDTVNIKDRSESDFFNFQNHLIVIKTSDQTFHFRLGDVSELTGNFYFQELNSPQKKVYIAKDTSLFEGMYKTELELFLNQYIRLKNYILSPPKSYLEKRVFFEILNEKISKIKINNRWNRWFELDVVNNTSIPKVRPGIGYLNFERKIKEALELVKFKDVFESGDLGEQTSKIEILIDKNKITATLFNSLDGRAGNFLKVQGHEWIYQLEANSEIIFFQNVQKFWDKKINFKTNLAILDRLDFVIDEKFKFFVDDLNKFEFNYDKKTISSINIANMNFLFHLIFGLEEFNQAQMISDLDKDIKEKKFSMKINILNKKLNIIFFEKDLIVQNLTDTYQLHYDYSFAKIKFNSINDFFALQ